MVCEQSEQAFYLQAEGNVKNWLKKKTIKMAKSVSRAGSTITISFFTQDCAVFSTIGLVSDTLYATSL